MKDDRIAEAIAIGEKNVRTFQLVRNWCAHAKMVKHGGTGLIEMQTGLPIGHHFIECPHAPAGGMAAFDLEDTAIDFYDRNCVDCKFRKPVGLPNISSLVAERDKKKKAQEQQQAKYAQEVADRLTAREAARNLTRTKLDALSVTTLDLISELDRTKSDAAAISLVELADLAPETFHPDILEHLFSLAASNEHWLIEPSLKVLSTLSDNAVRLCNTALQCLRHYSGREVAAAIVESRAKLANPALIEGALPALVHLANPAPSHFGMGDRRVVIVRGPLDALYRAHTEVVRSALKTLMENTDAYDVRTAARGLDTLLDIDSTLHSFLPLQLVSKLVRSGHLVLGREEDVEDALRDIRAVVTRSFLENPKEIDTLIDQYLAGARDENAAELYSVFDDVLRGIRFDRDVTGPKIITDAHRLAFKRMVVAATNAKGQELENSLTSVFHGDPYDLTPLVAEHLSLLLGSAAVLNTKIEEHDAPEVRTRPVSLSGWSV